MGLYDSYQLKNSREIPQYAGSALPELTKSLELAQQTYDSASTMDQDLAQTVLGTSVLDQDKETWNALNNKTQAELRDRITKGDYENMYGIVSQRARKTIAALKPLAEQIQRRSSYQQTLDDKELNLDESTKTALKEQSDRKYTGVKFDEQGRAIEGTQYSGLGAVKNIDVNDRIRKAITIANPDAEKVERSGDNGWQTWSRERGWEKLSPKKLANIVNQAYANDTEWQQSDEQKINTSTFHATKHVSDAMVLNFMKANSGTDVAKDLMDKITAGKSPADAYADIQSAAIREKIGNSRLGYGMGAEFYKGSEKRTDGIGPFALADYNKKINEIIPEGIVTPSPNESINPEETFDSLDNSIRENNTVIESAKQTANKWIQLDADGQPIMFNGKYLPKPGIDISKMPIDVANAITTLDTKVAENKAMKQRIDASYDQAAYDAGYKNPDGTAKGAYAIAKATIGKEAAVALKANFNMKDIIPTDMRYDNTFEDKPITFGTVYDQLMNGSAKFVSEGTGKGKVIMLANGKKVALPPSVGSVIGNGKDDEVIGKGKRVLEIDQRARDNYQQYSKNTSVTNPAASLDLSNPKLKAFSDNIVEHLDGARGDLSWKDNDGKVLDKDEIAKINLKGAIASRATKIGNSVIQTITVPSNDGSAEKTYRVTLPATSSLGRRYYQETLKAQDPEMQAFNKIMNPVSQIGMITSMQPNGRVKVAGTKNMYYKRNNDGNNIGYSIILDVNGKEQLLTTSKGAPFYTNDPSELETEALKHR